MNQMKTPQSYTQYKMTRRMNQRHKWQQGQAALGAGSNTDGIQAIIDLMAERGERMSRFLYDRIIAADYEVPESIRPAELAEV